MSRATPRLVNFAGPGTYTLEHLNGKKRRPGAGRSERRNDDGSSVWSAPFGRSAAPRAYLAVVLRVLPQEGDMVMVGTDF